MPPDHAAPVVTEPFSTFPQQREAALLGMWTFLATEVMLFGGLLLGITVYHVLYPEAVREASNHLYKSIGGVNTAILLLSSLAVSLAILAAREGRRRATVSNLLIAIGLGATFLGLKGFEYYVDYQEGLMPGGSKPFPIATPGAELFINAYFIGTGIHAIHLTIGVAVLAVVAWRVRCGSLPMPRRYMVMVISGLYWHFVDIVWIFLYPVLYLAGR